MLVRVFVAVFLLVAGGAGAQEVRLPVLELGVAGGGGFVPDYPAAGQNHLRGLAAPFLIYRGEILRSDDQGTRLRALLADDVEFSLSASGSLPVSSRDNKARAGMPDLDLMGEIGPTLRLTLWRNDDRAQPRRIVLDTPVRAVFSTDFSSVRFRGVTFSPDIAFEARNVLMPSARLRAAVGVAFASDRLMEYFYDVRPEFARPGRPAYAAQGGYLGARGTLSYRVPITERLFVGASVRAEYFGGARNADSPLFRREWNVATTLGVAYTLWQSEARVPVDAGPFD